MTFSITNRGGQLAWGAMSVLFILLPISLYLSANISGRRAGSVLVAPMQLSTMLSKKGAAEDNTTASRTFSFPSVHFRLLLINLKPTSAWSCYFFVLWRVIPSVFRSELY